ncbi:MAG: hypothetical protein WCO28_12700 [Bacteroidota bacterium]
MRLTVLFSEGIYFVRITDANGAIVKMQKVSVVRLQSLRACLPLIAIASVGR